MNAIFLNVAGIGSFAIQSRENSRKKKTEKRILEIASTRLSYIVGANSSPSFSPLFLLPPEDTQNPLFHHYHSSPGFIFIQNWVVVSNSK